MPAVDDDALGEGGAHAHDHLREVGTVVQAVAQTDELGLVVGALEVERRRVVAKVLGHDAEAAHELQGDASLQVFE